MSIATVNSSGPVWNNIQKKIYKIDEFLEIEDKDVQKYIYSTNQYKERNYVKVHEDDEKIAYYLVNERVAINQVGTFYKKNILVQWISYLKSTKKVKMSKDVSSVFSLLQEHRLKYVPLVKIFTNRPTATLCKKMIEGKIETIQDILKYTRSYSLRMKDLDLNVLYKYTVCNDIMALKLLNDPENLSEVSDFDKLRDINHMVYTVTPFKFNVDEIPKINERYDRWCETQSARLAEIERSRDAKDGNSDVQDSDRETETHSIKFSP